eukprot:NODE_9182_length_1441_cov_6.942161.p1 GENE.NODE_9182_length_1441_cov_6.942161~~NODE_9182_length_1441_cov_6.942161.p1  ORF type:complete len:392 (-),score=78.36 NODE_9182_length_1441_cov_6.942161:265-1341(-)
MVVVVKHKEQGPDGSGKGHTKNEKHTKSAKTEPTNGAAAAGLDAQKKKKKKLEAAAEDEKVRSLLSKLRPRPRPYFFMAFALFLAWLLVMFDPCPAKEPKKKKDCGWPGMAPAMCVTMGCLLKTGNEVSKFTVNLAAIGGEFGLVLEDAVEESLLVKEILPTGAVAEANADQPLNSTSRLIVGDRITLVNRVGGVAAMRKKLDGSSAKGVELKIVRSNLPAPLRFLHKPGQPSSSLETILSSARLVRAGEIFRYLGGAGFFGWFVSGYPVASLSTYLTVSGLYSFYATRSCYNSAVSGGVPHCYKGGKSTFELALKSARARTEAWWAEVQIDPYANLGIKRCVDDIVAFRPWVMSLWT